MRTHRGWPVLAIAAASVILGLTATVVVQESGGMTRPPAGTGSVSYPNGSAGWGRPMMGTWRQYPAAAPCPVPALPGSVVDVNLTDMGSMMGPRVMPGMGMMRILVYPNLIPAGQVSLRVTNRGALSHELVVLPLAPGQLSGHRLSGPDSRVDESGSLGEVSRTCGPDKGDEQSPDDGIAPHDSGWTTLALAPGRYELICNIAGHYVAGMSAELDVIGAAK